MRPPAPDPRGPTAWARVAALFVDYAVRRGVPRAAALAAARLADEELKDPDGRVPVAAIYDVVETITRATGDERFGLQMPLGLEIDALDALGFLFITGPTFGASLDRMLAYQRLWNEGERLELAIDGSGARMTYEPYGPPRPAHVQMAQVTMCDLVVNLPRFVPGLAFERVRFRHARPAEADAYEQTLGVPVAFNAAIDEARFATSMLDLPLPDSNASLYAFFERYADEKLRRLAPATDFAARVRALIRRQLPDGAVTLAALAPLLHVSGRTLQRRLGEEGSSLQAELDEVRRQQALYFLENGTAIIELSWLLGYSDASAFHRAFKRWTGTSPEAWRTHHGASVQQRNPSS